MVHLAAEFGRLWRGADHKGLDVLTPRERGAGSKSNYSGNFGLGDFPMHTDLAHTRSPPNFILLRCVKGYREVETLLIDGNQLIETIGKDILSRSLVSPRKVTEGRLPIYSILSHVDDKSRIRWDQIFLKPASRTGGTGFEEMAKAISEIEPIRISLAAPGDIWPAAGSVDTILR